jgi:hypothetical protein
MQPVPGLRQKEKEENDSTKSYVCAYVHAHELSIPVDLVLVVRVASGILLILLQGACQHTTHTTHTTPNLTFLSIMANNAEWVPPENNAHTSSHNLDQTNKCTQAM